MNGKWMFRLWMIVGAWCGLCAMANAAPPWGELISLKSVNADPENAYPLAEDHGPWMIMACSFSGEGAQKQAQELVYELRKRYKLSAYTYTGRFDPGEAQGRGVDEFGKPRKWKYAKYKDSNDSEQARHPELTEVAVLVGNFESADDPEAQRTLQKIKFAAPQTLEIKEGKQTHQTLTGWRMIQRQVYEAIGSEKKRKGPMGHAFITTNPLLPQDFFAPKNGVDPLVLKMNKNAEFSLLDCPGKYTVQVATFKGEAVIKQNEIREIENGRKEMRSSLAEAADKAHRLAKALRMKGYEAYEFHDRYSSIVTVGSFNSAGTPRRDGGMDLNPEIAAIVKTFAPNPNSKAELDPKFQNMLKANGLDQFARPMPVKSMIGIPFDVEPKPVLVPKRSFSVALRDRD